MNDDFYDTKEYFWKIAEHSGITFVILAYPAYLLFLLTAALSYADADLEIYGDIGLALWFAMPVVGILTGMMMALYLVAMRKYSFVASVALNIITTSCVLILNSVLVVRFIRMGYWFRPESSTSAGHLRLFVEQIGIPVTITGVVILFVIGMSFILASSQKPGRKRKINT